MTITEGRKIELVNMRVTLDGEPAYIAGSKLKFPWVVSETSNARYEFAWETVDRVVRENQGNFRS